jgi:hypothetical protein
MFTNQSHVLMYTTVDMPAASRCGVLEPVQGNIKVKYASTGIIKHYEHDATCNILSYCSHLSEKGS